MALWAKHWKTAARLLAVGLCVGSVGAFGCGKSEPAKTQESSENDARAAAPADGNETPKGGVEPSSEPVEDEFHHPFAKAVRLLDNPPFGCAVAPSTVSGKSVYKIYRDVAAQWDGIRFTTADGKRIHYSATIMTDFGEIDIELRPDLAPNHVRSFVALARAKYYEHLFFDRVNHEEYPDKPGLRNDFLEAGCPLGSGEDGFGNVGYWLYPETQPREKASHVAGTVGACRGVEKDSAGSKFYIMLNELHEADGLFTIFGQVTRGLDVAKKIFAQPVAVEDRGRFGCLKPEVPVMIKDVLIYTSTEGAEGKN